MDLREEIESLGIWFIVTTIILFAFKIIYVLAINISDANSVQEILNNWSSAPVGLMVLSSLSTLLGLIDNFAIAIWLYLRTRACGYNPYLWAAFGFVGTLLGGALYFLARFTESRYSNEPHLPITQDYSAITAGKG